MLLVILTIDGEPRATDTPRLLAREGGYADDMGCDSPAPHESDSGDDQGGVGARVVCRDASVITVRDS